MKNSHFKENHVRSISILFAFLFQSIKKGSFVCLYVGEVILAEEAERRSKEDKGIQPYLFDLDFNDHENPVYTVDASTVGNVSHFINHSCEPNLGVYAVWVDCLDPNLPKLAMFALSDIARVCKMFYLVQIFIIVRY